MTTGRQTERLSTDDLANPAPPATTEPSAEGQATAPEPVTTGDARTEPAAPSETTASEPLVDDGDDDGFRRRWDSIQAGFVDEPRNAVEQADALVAELMQRLAETFSNERKGLEGQWDRGQDVSTEDLRVALQRYRSFFDRLLTT